MVAKKDFDLIASSLNDASPSFFKRAFLHKTPILGNYDLDTLVFALIHANVSFEFFPHNQRSFFFFFLLIFR
jgi:hypothetical protein